MCRRCLRLGAPCHGAAGSRVRAPGRRPDRSGVPHRRFVATTGYCMEYVTLLSPSGRVNANLTPLMTPEDVDAAMAKSPSYRPPGS